MAQSKSVLIMGGSGQAGGGAAALLRQWHRRLPLTIAGRNAERAARVAADLGNATAVTLDLRRSDLGLPAEPAYSAVIAAVWDAQLHGLRYAQRNAVPYLGISSGLVDIGPEVVAGAQRPGAAPILLASHYLAGLVVLATLHFAREFDRVDAIRIGAVLDETDAGGPAAIADLERLLAATSAGLIRRDGVFTWLPEEQAGAEVRRIDGTSLPGRTIPILDVPSLALATGAPEVRFDFAVGESASRRRGGPPSLETRIELAGVGPAGTSLTRSRYLFHPAGQRPLTALGVALGAERLLGLRGDPVAAGLHTPEGLVDPAHAVERMIEVGATFTDA
ncbi:saccharopine dehydrogenase [Nocardia wallacei]|uniref:saccharopine dehydrogenase n=1 Tax=Nocardia wallacei TaxID=480035 RepID=UPI002456704F|nr:saccharopine dehydrogenase [Nocardia wallacei]